MKNLKTLTPKKIVEELNKYIIGQNKAKKAVAIALRNRWRRQQVRGELQQEILPNNIILIGPTGVGKTEIARRLSKLSNAPFIKVEASKFTEIGYVGRDVESMIRELMDVSVNEVRFEMSKEVQKKALANAKEKVLDILVPEPKRKYEDYVDEEQEDDRIASYKRTRQKMSQKLEQGLLDDRVVTVNLESARPPFIEFMPNMGIETIDINLTEMLSSVLQSKHASQSKKMKVKDAVKHLTALEANKLVKQDKVVQEAKYRVENNGIIFIDEIDKIATAQKGGNVDVSRSGVQRDLLPIVEGSNVPTKYGIINTAHILFIAAGAFNFAKPSDLIPELQGRFPIREELNSLTKNDFEKILRYPKNALIKQYEAIFKTEKVNLTFTEDSISLIAEYAAKANEKMEDIGARRLNTIMNSLLENYLFEMPKASIKKVDITREFVTEKLESIIKDEDLSKYIL